MLHVLCSMHMAFAIAITFAIPSASAITIAFATAHGCAIAIAIGIAFDSLAARHQCLCHRPSMPQCLCARACIALSSCVCVCVRVPMSSKHEWHGTTKPKRPQARTHATPRGFEPLRAEPNGFQGHLLNRSDTVSLTQCLVFTAHGFGECI